MQQVFASNSYHLMHQTNKDTQNNHFQNIGDLECSGACLSEKRMVGDRDTQELLPRWLLLLGPAPLSPKLAAAPPKVLARIPEASLPLEYLLHAYA